MIICFQSAASVKYKYKKKNSKKGVDLFRFFINYMYIKTQYKTLTLS